MKYLRLLFFILLFSDIVLANSITRSFNINTISPNQELEVTINVDLDENDKFYVIEEHVPNGFTVVDNNGADNTISNILVWIEFQNPGDITYKYVVKATANTGNYEFDGNYTISNPNVKAIQGDKNIQVVNDNITTFGVQTSGNDGGSNDGGPKRIYQCNDKIDNDGDKLIDLQDPGCTGILDNSEVNKKECRERWVCDDWQECKDNIQIRECYDTNNCGTEKNKPKTEQDCIEEFKEIKKTENNIKQEEYNKYLVILIVSIAIIFIIVLIRKRFNSS